MDDVNCLALGKSLQSVTRSLQDRTDIQLERARPLCLTFAPGKSDLVHFVPPTSSKKPPSSAEGSLSDTTIVLTPLSGSTTEITPSHSIRYLGVIIDERLSFRPHALEAVARCRQSLNALRFLGGRQNSGVIAFSTWRHLALSVLLPKMT